MALVLAACTNAVLETVRKVTYPPDFNYISNQKLTTTMQQFTWYTSLLDYSLQSVLPVPEEQRAFKCDIYFAEDGRPEP